MVVTRLACQGFRNLEDGEIFPCSGVNVIYGDNAQERPTCWKGFGSLQGGTPFGAPRIRSCPGWTRPPGKTAPPLP